MVDEHILVAREDVRLVVAWIAKVSTLILLGCVMKRDCLPKWPHDKVYNTNGSARSGHRGECRTEAHVPRSVVTDLMMV